MKKNSLTLWRMACALILLGGSAVSFADGVVAVSPVARGSRTIKIDHDKPSYYSWKTDEPVCVNKGNQEVQTYCGNITNFDVYTTIIRFPLNEARFSVGDKVAVIYPKRNPASELPTTEAMKIQPLKLSKTPKNSVEIAASTTLSYLAFSLLFNQAVGEKWVLGISPSYQSDSSAGVGLKAIGFSALIHYYFKERFTGLYLGAGAGFYSLKITTSSLRESFTPLSVLGMLGWRGRISKSAFTLGFSAGGQYVTSFNSQMENNFGGTHPRVAMDVGLTF